MGSILLPSVVSCSIDRCHVLVAAGYLYFEMSLSFMLKAVRLLTF